jgi:hypothetical protein
VCLITGYTTMSGFYICFICYIYIFGVYNCTIVCLVSISVFLYCLGLIKSFRFFLCI